MSADELIVQGSPAEETPVAPVEETPVAPVEETPVVLVPTPEQVQIAEELLQTPCTSGYAQVQAQKLEGFWDGTTSPDAIKAAAEAVVAAATV